MPVHPSHGFRRLACAERAADVSCAPDTKPGNDNFILVELWHHSALLVPGAEFDELLIAIARTLEMDSG
jgi:hypothetical protein